MMTTTPGDLHQTSWPSWPHFSTEEIAAVTTILQTGKVNYWTGDQGRLFEQEYAKALGTNYAVCMMNGTVALEAALYALNIGPGDEVITTPRTFIASASAIVLRGATPIFADVDEHSQNITSDTISKVISKRTKAIITVHLAGWPCEMDAIMSLAQEHGLYVIEDCAQAHGAIYQDRPIGSWGHIAAFSFCQDKIITTGGEGGMVVTNDERLYKKMWSYKDHGKDYDLARQKKPGMTFNWLHETFGTNWRMTEIQAAIGRIQLKKLPEWTRIRQENATILTEALSHLPILTIPTPGRSIQHAYYKYYAFIREEKLKLNWNRDKILQSISAYGAPCFVGSCSEIYHENAFVRAALQPVTRLPIAKKLGETSLMFLLHPTLTTNDMKKMAAIIEKVMHEATG